MVVHSSRQEQRRQQRLAREIQASAATLEATVREAARQEYCCHADAAAAAAKLRALQSAYHGVTGDGEEPPTYGPGRPSSKPPRVVKARRYGRHVPRHEPRGARAGPEAERRVREQQGIVAWKAWVEKHQAAIAAMGGPLGKTKKVDSSGIADIANGMGAFTVVRACSHEAAAKLFENHPHFAIFPGERVEIMPVLPIPGG